MNPFIDNRSKAKRISRNAAIRHTPVPPAASSVLATLRVEMAMRLPRRQAPPSVYASHPSRSAMGCAGASHADVARRVPPKGSAIILPALLGRLSAVFPAVETVTTVLTSRATPRVVSRSLSLAARNVILTAGS